MSSKIFEFALAILNNLPLIIAAGRDVMKYIEDNVKILRLMQQENRDPTDAEWDALNNLTRTLRDERPALATENNA